MLYNIFYVCTKTQILKAINRQTALLHNPNGHFISTLGHSISILEIA